MNRVQDILVALSRHFATLAGMGAVLMMAMIAADVTLRLMGRSFPMTIAIVTNYLMLMVAFLPLARLERTDGMITVDVITMLLGPRGQRLLIIVSGAIVLLIYAVLFWASLEEAIERLRGGAYVLTMRSTLYTWPAYFLVPAGFILAALVVLMRILSALASGAETPETDPSASSSI